MRSRRALLPLGCIDSPCQSSLSFLYLLVREPFPRFVVSLCVAMHRHTQAVLFCAFLLGISAPSRGQENTRAEAAKIINSYVKASGGSHLLSRVRTLSLEGSVTVPTDATGAAEAGGPADAFSGTYTLDTKFPNRYYSELILGGKHFIQSYNGKSAWHDEASSGPSTMVGTDSLELEAEAQFANSRLVNLKKSGLYAVLLGHASVQGKDAVQVELTSASGIKRELFFDPASHFLIEESGPVGGINDQIFYSSYAPQDGLQVPRHIELHRGPAVYSIAITAVTVNGVLGERIFDLPLSSQVQLPDLKALFKEIDANQKAIDKIKEDYAGVQTEEEIEYGSNGEVKKRTVTASSFFYDNGEEISTVTARNGKPLTPAEAQKETEKAQKRVEEIQKEQQKKDAADAKAKQEGKETKEEKDDDVGIEMFLRVCQFVNPRRERFRGQDVLVFDFEGNPEYKPRNLAEKIVQKLAGVIWVDEKAHDVARLEAHFVGDAKIAGGLLATVQKGTAFVFEQEYVNNEVWLPTYAEANVGARVLLVKGLHLTDVTRYSDYKKYHVETHSVIAPPKLPQ
jgi:hypothetical protein